MHNTQNKLQNMTGLAEQIGGVTLDYTYYPGEDFYSDGAVEDELLDIVQQHAPAEYDNIIRQRKKWPILYHLSRERENIVDWLPFTGREKVLEIGSGAGAITGALARRCGHVTCVELSRKRSLINAYRHKDADNVTIMVGNFEDIEPHLDKDYDYIFLIGVLEYARSYIHHSFTEEFFWEDSPADHKEDAASVHEAAAVTAPHNAASRTWTDPFCCELRRIRRHIRQDEVGNLSGRMVIAIENRLGMKYFAGCREDHSGRFFDGIENYENGEHPATTFSRPALEHLLGTCGLNPSTFYYPYPDYKFMETLYSDKRLPEGAELSDNIRNFDRDRLLLFDEKKAYDGVTADGLYPLFSNSFEAVIGPHLPVIYCKYSSDRAPQYRIRTALLECRSQDHEGNETRNQSGTTRREIRKYPLCPQAGAHVERLLSSYQKLQQRFHNTIACSPCGQDNDVTASGRFFLSAVAPCHRSEDGSVAMDYIAGETLENALDQALEAQNKGNFLQLLSQYLQYISQNAQFPCADYDMTFANIMITPGTGGNPSCWSAIDYEWEIDEAIAPKELFARALICYEREDALRKDRIDKLLGEAWEENLFSLTKEDLDKATKQEDQFQGKVSGGTISLGALRAQLDAKVIRPVELQTPKEREEGRRRNREEELRQQQEAYEKSRALTGVKVYYDTGCGFNEQETMEIPRLYGQESTIAFEIPVSSQVKNLRVDPASVPCIVMLREMYIMKYPETGTDPDRQQNLRQTAAFIRNRRHNGSSCQGGAVLYATSDPWMSWDMDKMRRKLASRPRDYSSRDDNGVLTIHMTLQMSGIPGTMAEMIIQNDNIR